MSSEKQLIDRLKKGDAKAVHEWFTNYHNRLFHYVSRRVGETSDVEELVQETFLHALKQLPLFRGSSTLWTWMVAIARHEVADYYRKRYAKKALRTVPLMDTLLTKRMEDSSQVSAQVLACLARMRGSSAELLRLKYIDKKRVVDIAKEWGKSVKAIESELFRARNEFRNLYKLTLRADTV